MENITIPWKFFKKKKKKILGRAPGKIFLKKQKQV